MDNYEIETYEMQKRPDYPHMHLVKMWHSPAGPSIQTLRVTSPDEPPAIAAPPTPYDTNMAFIDSATNERLAILGVVRLQPDVDGARPTLSLSVMGLSAFPLPDWPITFGSLDPEDPGAGVWLSLNTPETVSGRWIPQSEVI
ncbi:hypothetical protein SEA_LILBEANIE_71 [Gordonia phage Lilbeanie]|uniref:Uncharacterized protein n=1 Tax=Gordonia phage Lilbeanie TaxID=2794947 RepID=A0A7T1KSB6_9CAUD|nr:hypothetical protein J1773_gp71 [Gordonia phage Lilbeanie]QPO17149.1 hypothetical protein SEA_LILBEANIE_71 [Gordonia phage Lilbeanie]